MLKAYVGVVERTLAFPLHALRRFVMAGALSAFAALLATTVSMLLRRTRQPRLPRMSDDWVRRHDLDSWRYDPWRGY
ncbi:MAG: hypothetical protein ACRD3C_21515 [Vicinamibacterales bacterium]